MNEGEKADGCGMELLADVDVASMDVAVEQASLLACPDAIAIASIGRLLGQRIHNEVQEYTTVLGRLVADMQRVDIDCDEAGDRDRRPDDGDAPHRPCCAARLLRMHVLMAAIGRALDQPADQ